MSTLSPGHRLFVYGSLRRGSGHPMHRSLARQSEFLGEGQIVGELYDLGHFPGITTRANESAVVKGEVYELESDEVERLWAMLDGYEGCGANDPTPHLYRRGPVTVTLSDGGEVGAWAYLLCRVPPTAVLVPGGDYLAWRTPATV